MAEIKYSVLLTSIMQHAQRLCAERECSDLTRDYIIVAAINILDSITPSDSITQDEVTEARALLEKFTRDESRLNSTLEKWQQKTVPVAERITLLAQREKALRAARSLNKTSLPATFLLKEILKEESDAMKNLHTPLDESPSITSVSKKTNENCETPARPSDEKSHPEITMHSIIQKTKDLQSALEREILGQQHAISVFSSGYFHSELISSIEENRKRPRATFLFAGPPGVGKTFFAETAASLLGLPFRRFDMSEYTGPNSTDELAGSDANYKASSEGLLTGYVRQNPRCLLLFDEIEKASRETIHLFLQILDAGLLRDNRTDEEVSFKDSILIFTTNAGKQLYSNSEHTNLSLLSRDVILDALAHDINPITKEPFFPEAICSRFASGNVLMFNHLDAHSLRQIVEKQLATHTGNLNTAMDITVNMDNNVSAALLLSEGAGADARTVKSRADSFFSGELYELYRLISSDNASEQIDKIRTIHISVNQHGENESVLKLFSPSERIHFLAYSKKIEAFEKDDPNIPFVHYVSTIEEAKVVIENENIQLILCDLFDDNTADEHTVLNIEDHPSRARDFLFQILKFFPDIPKILIESEEHTFSEEEKFSYMHKGITGFLFLDQNTLLSSVKQYTDRIFQQNCLTALARGNQLLRFETSQTINNEGDTANIVIFDMKLEKAIKAEDADNVMSLLSTPNVAFNDIIGAEDAKSELQFFVSYMCNPKKYLKKGLSAPKGILLYGPPGTGKTMLAKAFAAESGATFIATEGNQFYKGIVGQGAEMVHKLFATARRYAPSVIFIDEIDTIARTRSGRDSDMAQDSEQILTALFAEMDGFSTDTKKPVFLLAATNYSVEPGSKMSLDPAMLRRFDRRILIDLPNIKNRTEYLKKEIDSKEIFNITDSGIIFLSDRSTGMSLAQLSSILDLSIRTAMQKGLDSVTDKILEEAFEIFNGGEAKKWNAETTLRTARHEAGHALISWLSGEKPSYVTIVSRGNYGGYMQYSHEEERMGFTKQELLSRIRSALGGRAAEIVYYGAEDGLSTGVSGDLRTATELAKQMLCTYGMADKFGLAVVDPNNNSISQTIYGEINNLLREQFNRAVELITANQEKMNRLVERLLENNSLNKSAIDNILSGEL